ncbi:MAG: hypothetical protein R3B72_49650, partial [Polyangiaceae bacterium]
MKAPLAPGEDGLAGGGGERLAGAGVEARGGEGLADHRDGGDDGVAAEGIDEGARLALDVELGLGGVKLVGGARRGAEAVVGGDGEGAAEGVEAGDGGGVDVGVGADGGFAIGIAARQGEAGVVPGLPHVGRVVAIVVGGGPGIEGDALDGAVGVIDADEAAEGVVAEERGDAPGGEIGIVLVLLGGREVGLVLLDGQALVVEDGAAGADPAGRGGRELHDALAVLHGVARAVERDGEAVLGEHLGEQLMAGAVGVGEAHDPARACVGMGLAPLGADARGEAVLGVAVELVAEGGRRRGEAVPFPALAGDGGGDDAAEGIESGERGVAVGIGDGRGGEDAVVERGGGGVAEGIGHLGDEQRGIVVDDGERLAVHVGEARGLVEGGGVVGRQPRPGPAVAIGEEIEVARLVEAVGRLAVEIGGAREQTGGEGELVGGVGERQGACLADGVGPALARVALVGVAEPAPLVRADRGLVGHHRERPGASELGGRVERTGAGEIRIHLEALSFDGQRMAVGAGDGGVARRGGGVVGLLVEGDPGGRLLGEGRGDAFEGDGAPAVGDAGAFRGGAEGVHLERELVGDAGRERGLALGGEGERLGRDDEEGGVGPAFGVGSARGGGRGLQGADPLRGLGDRIGSGLVGGAVFGVDLLPKELPGEGAARLVVLDGGELRDGEGLAELAALLEAGTAEAGLVLGIGCRRGPLGGVGLVEALGLLEGTGVVPGLGDDGRERALVADRTGRG